jgi:hypothetical protein
MASQGAIRGMVMFHDMRPLQSPANLYAVGDQARVVIKSRNLTLVRAALKPAEVLST